MHIQDSAGNPAAVDDVQRWVDTFSLTFPVLADEAGVWAGEWGPDGRYSQRTYMVIGTDGRIEWVQSDGDPGSAAELIERVEAAP